MLETIKEPVMRELVRANSITKACLIGKAGGFAVSIAYAAEERLLATSRGDIRLFTLEGAQKYLCELGIPRFEVDASGYLPGRLRKARPDRAEALRNTRTTPRQTELLP